MPTVGMNALNNPSHSKPSRVVSRRVSSASVVPLNEDDILSQVPGMGSENENSGDLLRNQRADMMASQRWFARSGEEEWWEGDNDDDNEPFLGLPDVVPGCRSTFLDCHDDETGVVVATVPKWRVHHASELRKWWDSVTITILLYILISLPILVAFTIENETTYVIGTAIDAFFMLDVFMNFITTYEDDQLVLVTDFGKIACNYFQTWFVVDLVSSVPFQLFPGLNGSASGAARGLKIVKLVKLLRVFRLNRTIMKLQEKYQIKHATIMITKFILSIFLVAHWLGCLFYFFSKLQDHGDEANPRIWSEFFLYNTTDGSLESRSDIDKYVAVFYWSLTTMSTIGYGDIVPKTTTEMVMVIIAMLFGACFFAYFLTNLCSLIFNHSKQTGRFEAATDFLTEYVDRHLFSPRLSRELLRSLWFGNTSSTIEDEVTSHAEMLSFFSPEMQRQAYRHLASATFCKAGQCPPPILVAEERVLVQLFLVARAVIYPPNEAVWCTYPDRKQWDPRDAVYYVVKGRMKVDLEHAEDKRYHETELPPGSSFGERQVFLYGDYPVNDTMFKTTEFADVYIVNRRALKQILKPNPTHVKFLMDILKKRRNDWIARDELVDLQREFSLALNPDQVFDDSESNDESAAVGEENENPLPRMSSSRRRHSELDESCLPELPGGADLFPEPAEGSLGSHTPTSPHRARRRSSRGAPASMLRPLPQKQRAKSCGGPKSAASSPALRGMEVQRQPKPRPNRLPKLSKNTQPLRPRIPMNAEEGQDMADTIIELIADTKERMASIQARLESVRNSTTAGENPLSQEITASVPMTRKHSIKKRRSNPGP